MRSVITMVLWQSDAVGGAPFPPRPPTLLVVVLHGLAEGVVDHKADVGLVYTHANGHSGYNDLMGGGLVM